MHIDLILQENGRSYVAYQIANLSLRSLLFTLKTVLQLARQSTILYIQLTIVATDLRNKSIFVTIVFWGFSTA